MKLNIDLGNKPESMKKDSLPEISSANYPEITFRTGDALELPKSGRLVVDFEVTHTSTNEHKGRKPEHSCTICVKRLVTVNKKGEPEEEAKAPVRKSTASDTESSLDNIAKEQGYK